MGNKLFDLMNQAPMQMPGAMGNFQNLINQYNQFRSMFRGNPQQIIQNMVNGGQINQNQLNQAIEMAKNFRNHI